MTTSTRDMILGEKGAYRVRIRSVGFLRWEWHLYKWNEKNNDWHLEQRGLALTAKTAKQRACFWIR